VPEFVFELVELSQIHVLFKHLFSVFIVQSTWDVSGHVAEFVDHRHKQDFEGLFALRDFLLIDGLNGVECPTQRGNNDLVDL